MQINLGANCKKNCNSIQYITRVITEQMVMNELIEPGLDLCCCYCLKQKRLNQNTLFARLFMGLSGAETKILSC